VSCEWVWLFFSDSRIFEEKTGNQKETAMSTVTQENSGSSKLSDLQISLLRLFDQELNQQQTLEVRMLLMDYFDQKLQAELDDVTARKDYSEADYHRMLRDDNFPAD
jgi:hypothetical protein